MNLLLSTQTNQVFQTNRFLNRFRRLISKSRKKPFKKDGKDDVKPKNPFGRNPPFGGIPALAF
jgi:hypothetical protein